MFLLLLLSPFSHIPSVLYAPDASPTKEDKESEFWKTLHEPEEQAAGGEEAPPGVRRASQPPLRSLDSGFGRGRVPRAEVYEATSVSRDERTLLEEHGGYKQVFMPESALSPHQEQDLNPEAAADPAPNPPNGQSTVSSSP